MGSRLAQLKQKLKWLDPFTYVDLALDKYWPVKGKEKTLAQEIGYNVIYVVSAFAFAFIIYQAFAFALSTSSPIVIVVSESMEPVFYRGDVMFVQGIPAENLAGTLAVTSQNLFEMPFSEFASASYSGGELQSIEIDGKSYAQDPDSDIIVYNSRLLGEQIIHRIFLKIKANDGYYFLTKGDNKKTNKTFDQDCGKVTVKYSPGTDIVEGYVLEKPCIDLFPETSKEIQGRTIFRIPAVGCVKVWFFDDLPSLIFRHKMPDSYYSSGNWGIC